MNARALFYAPDGRPRGIPADPAAWRTYRNGHLALLGLALVTAVAMLIGHAAVQYIAPWLALTLASAVRLWRFHRYRRQQRDGR